MFNSSHLRRLIMFGAMSALLLTLAAGCASPPILDFPLLDLPATYAVR